MRAHPSLYTARGDFHCWSSIWRTTAPAPCAGPSRVKQKLLAEGLFDPARKKPLPAFPRRLGVITSPSGAAIHDILHVLGRRFPSLPGARLPVPVQGADAAPTIADAIASRASAPNATS